MSADPNRLRELFEKALDLPEPRRDAFLDDACGDDAGLRHELAELLAAERGMGSFLGEGELGKAAAATLPAEDEPLTGQTIGRYRVHGEIARGGMGVVYRAGQTNPDRTVALKILAHGLTSPEAVRRFEVEVQVLGRLQHPGIAQIFEAGTADTGRGARPFFAMEYIDGQPLTRWADERQLDLRERLRLLVKVCDGVHHAHQKGVIHRDLKPANILVDASGQPKILDFGVARSTDADLQLTTIGGGSSGGLLGTLPYMSPEQVRGDAGLLDTRSDVYALGVIAYELLCGRQPHDLKGKSLTDAIRTISESRPEPLARVRSGIPGDVQTIVDKALEADPSRRYDSASALGADIGRFLVSRPIVARPQSALYMLRKVAARNRLASGLVALLAVLLVAGAVTLATQTQRIRRERDRATREARTAAEVSDFLQGLFAVTDPRFAQGEEPTARELLDRGADNIFDELSDQPAVQARLLVVMGDTYRNLGRLEAARDVLEQAVERARLIVEDEPSTMVQALQALAWAYRATAQIKDGVAAAEEAVQIAAAYLPSEHRSRGYAMTALGALLRDDGQWDAARETLERATAFAEQVRGPESAELAAALNHLAWLEHRLGRDEQAASIYSRSCSMLEQALGPDRPELASCFNDHSAVLVFLGRHDEAGELLEKSIDVKKRILPPGHPEVATAVSNLGSLQLRAGGYEEAIEQYERALEMRRAALGPDHPDVGGTLCNIGIAQHRLRRWQDAEATFRECIGFLERTSGPDGRLVTANLINLEKLYEDLGYFEEALALNERILASRERTHGVDHAWYAGTLRSRARTLIWLRRPAEAERDLRRAIEIIGEDFPLEQPGRARFDIDLAETLLLQGRTDEARGVLKTVLAVHRDLEPNDAKALCLFSLGRLALLENDTASAETWFEEALDVRNRYHAPGHAMTLYTQAVLRGLQGERREALDALRGALEKRFSWYEVDIEIDFGPLRDDPELMVLIEEFTPNPTRAVEASAR